MTPRMNRMRIAGLCLAIACATAGAQQPDEPEVLPAIDPAHALGGTALLEALRQGGFVLFLRHADQGTLRQTPDCATPQLTPAGADEARRLGEALRAARIPIGAVRSSPLCRALQTARELRLGEPELAPELQPAPDPAVVAARMQALGSAPPAGKNTLLVSHVHGGARREERLFAQKLEIVAFRPRAGEGARAVARIQARDWEALLREAAPAR